MRQLWLRHRNGGGKKYGNDCEVSDDTSLDRTSAVGDEAEVYDSIVRGSCIYGQSIVSRALVLSSTVRDQCRIIGSGGRPVIKDCDLSGTTKVWQAPTLHNVDLVDVRVYGTAKLEGPWSLKEFVRIHRGTWTAPPRYLLIEGENINTILSECVDDHYHIGCWCLPRETWFRKGYKERLGAHAGWTPEQIELAFNTTVGWLTQACEGPSG